MRNLIIGLAVGAAIAGSPAAATTTVTFTLDNITYLPVTHWVVPYTTRYTITATGGSGGDAIAGDLTRRYGGLGAGVVGTFDLTMGTMLDIIVGGAGRGYETGERVYANGNHAGGGGGGASSVAVRTPEVLGDVIDLLLEAGGGGGAGGGLAPTTYANGGDGRIVSSGYSFGTAPAGVSGGGGAQGTGDLSFDTLGRFRPERSHGAGGGGTGWVTGGGSGYIDGGGGGNRLYGGSTTGYGGGSGGIGGRGGGGSGGYYGEGGGGGGYSGGAGGDRETYDCPFNCTLGGLPGGGGGSFNSGIFQFGIAGYQLGDGAVFVSFDAPPDIDPGGGGHDVKPPVAGVPEPASWALLVAGFGLVGGVARRRRPPVAA